MYGWASFRQSTLPIVNFHFGSFPLQQSPESKKPAEIISYWHPNLTINLMDDQTPWVQGSVPQPMDECMS